ncbi:hypothetical protein [Pedobacter sp. Hv1]|uniref:hypothetical protein n=1 Tax=Pedobacter sp. Hv1 TaxID=1740090 RepID=UPI0006D8C7AC|nr:hypothetical protein [Pedobacter sp. Hv1]KQC00947.1 hypothetical protein AQF98_09760 [Pedobacter sp. Hv1]
MSDKIEDNSSFKKFDKNIKSIKAIKQIASLFSPFSKDAKDISKLFAGMDNIEQQFKALSKSPDEFNSLFSELGWIAHESINHDLMLECIALAKNNDIAAAEEKLADYYTSDVLKHLSHQLKGTKEFYPRYPLIRLAYEDTIAKRFHAAVPLILMIIDGGVNDIDKNKGFFTESTDLTAWDSIAAHSSGLTKLRDIFNKGRNKTNEEEIRLPYRNGILHGRDIAYANKFVAGKCWAALMAINDWAKALKDGKKTPPKKEEEKESSLKEILENLTNVSKEFQKHREKIDEGKRLIDNWKPRNLIVGTDIPASGNVGDYEEFTPESDAIKFMHHWQKKNYGAMAKQVSYYAKDVVLSKEAAKVRGFFDGKLLKSFELKKVIDCAPAISEVFIDVCFEFEQKKYKLDLKLRMIYQNEKKENLILGQENGEWKFVDTSFFNQVSYPI